MNHKHGLSQYRLNYAKSYAQNLLEAVNKIEMMFQLSNENMVDENLAENYINHNIEDLDRSWDEFKSYITQREDMR